MLRLLQEVIITQLPTSTEPSRNKVLYFPAINTVTVSESFDDMTATAEVVLPRNLKFEDSNIYTGKDALIRRGDRIRLSTGYHPNLKVVFDGYISKVDNNVPIVLKCEDKMWAVKQTICPTMSLTDITLIQLIDLVMDAYTYDEREGIEIKVMENFTISSIRINECSVGVVLKKLRDEYGVYSFFKNGIMYVGLAFYPDLAKKETFLFEKVIIDNDLEFLKKEDVKVQVKGVLIKEDNTREEIQVGDSTGDTRTIFQYGGSVDDLKKTINNFLQQMNYTGYYGSFTTFVEPKVNQGDYAVIDSYKYPERKGTYLIKSVNTTFGVNGGRQNIELERRIE